MNTERADVIIVGAGLAGSAAARAMTSRGRSVVLLEAFQPGHRRGSSHGSARIFRRAYPDPLYVRLTGQAQDLWRQLADEVGEELITTTGAVDYGPAREQEKMYEILTGFGVPAELMPAEAAAERWPGMAFGPDPVMFHPDGGVLDPERAMAAMRGIAAACGARIHYGAPVLRVQAGGEGAEVHTEDRSWRAPVVIAAAGSWLEPLLGGLVPLPRLTVTQVQAFHFAPRAPGPWLAFIYHDEVTRYGLPAGRDGEVPGAVKVGEHRQGTVTTGDGRDGIVSPAARDRVRAFVRQRLGGLDDAPVGEVTCMYTSTASEDFVLDRHGPFVVCSPCSGHGAKFAPLVGEIAADLACGGSSPELRFTLAAHRGWPAVSLRLARAGPRRAGRGCGTVVGRAAVVRVDLRRAADRVALPGFGPVAAGRSGAVALLPRQQVTEEPDATAGRHIRLPRTALPAETASAEPRPSPDDPLVEAGLPLGVSMDLAEVTRLILAAVIRRFAQGVGRAGDRGTVPADRRVRHRRRLVRHNPAARRPDGAGRGGRNGPRSRGGRGDGPVARRRACPGRHGPSSRGTAGAAEPLDQGIIALRSVLARESGPLEAVCDALITSLAGRFEDDITVMLARIPPDRAS